MTEESLPWPTVIIGGAPRAGTSSLYDLLQGTGAFGRRTRKELFLLNDPDFWIQGVTPGYACVGPACYEQAGFRDTTPFIDASSTYLYQRTAPTACARRLADRPGSPFLVVFCLRDPAQRLYSNFRYFRDVLRHIPAATRFSEYAVALLDGGWHSGNQQVDQALVHGEYARYLSRWHEAVGTRHIMTIQTQSLTSDGRAVAGEIGRRLGLSLEAAEGRRENAAYRPRFAALHTLARRAGSLLPHGTLRERL